MLTLNIEGIEYPIPGDWEEVTVAQFNQMTQHVDNLNPVRVLSILTGLDYNELNNYDCSGFSTSVLPALGYLQEVPELHKAPRKEAITIGGRKVPVIKDPGRERIGQKLLMTSILLPQDGKERRISEVVDQIVANYYAPKLHPEGRWDDEHVEAIRGEVQDMPIMEAMPEVNFLLIGFGYASSSKPSSTL